MTMKSDQLNTLNNNMDPMSCNSIFLRYLPYATIDVASAPRMHHARPNTTLQLSPEQRRALILRVIEEAIQLIDESSDLFDNNDEAMRRSM